MNRQKANPCRRIRKYLATFRYYSGSGTDVDPAVESDDQPDTNESGGMPYGLRHAPNVFDYLLSFNSFNRSYFFCGT